VLLNRRGVVSFEQLLLDVSEALGFPRWHRGRVTRLFTPHGREVSPHRPPTAPLANGTTTEPPTLGSMLDIS
jgi:hypothetical protein